MKWLLYLVLPFACFRGISQSFPVRNMNEDYVVSNLKGYDRFTSDISEVIRDKSGLYWFHSLSQVSSYDGVTWKDYDFKAANDHSIPLRINELEVTDDGSVWLATAEGLFIFDRRADKFIRATQRYPGAKVLPNTTNCIFKGLDNFLLVSVVKEGFYSFDWKTGAIKHVIIDSVEQIHVQNLDNEVDITVDKAGHYWGLTREHKGIWFYDPATGIIKRSWKGELFPASAIRWEGKNSTAITYSQKEDALILCYGPGGILEKLSLATGNSTYYSFEGDLNVRADTNSAKRLPILRAKIDRDGNEWILVAGKYIVKLHSDIRKFECLENNSELLLPGRMEWMLSENDISNGKGKEDILLWLLGERGLSMLRKRNQQVFQFPFEKKSAGGITPADYINRNVIKGTPFKNIYFINGPGDGYFMLQSNPGRPKLIRMDATLHITHTLFNDRWKEYSAYFRPESQDEKFYIAILRNEIEPLDFREVVIKDFRVDLASMKVEETTLSFRKRVWRYGVPDLKNIFWLLSNGYLYSYDPLSDALDSMFIYHPRDKAPYSISRIKGYDYPTLLDKASSTFWISFIAEKELYKIDLRQRKIIAIKKGCLDKLDCLHSAVFQLYPVDSARIYLKLNMSGALLNPVNDSITMLTDLFKNRLPYETQVGALRYKDWLCCFAPSEINLQNLVSGQQKRLSVHKDFTWHISEFNCSPPVTEKGEIILLSNTQGGFIIFNPDSIPAEAKPGSVGFSGIMIDNHELRLDSLLQRGWLRLKYNHYRSLHFKLSDLSLINQEKIQYEYTLYSSGDTLWNRIEGSPELTFSKISPGKYTLLTRASNGFGDYSPVVSALPIMIIPPFTQTILFFGLVVMAIILILYVIYRYRLQQLRKLQVIRNNIASDLHDDIGSTLNSISIYSEVAKQQAGKDIPALDLIGINSRSIIESMSDIVWTINPQNDSFEKIIIRMRSFAYHLLKAKKIEYSFEVDEQLNLVTLPMQVRKNFYLVFKEGITNLIKYSGASRVLIELYWENKTIVLKIRDNGIGIPVNPETEGNGLMNMKRRAEEIHASLVIHSAIGEGTGIEMKLKK